MAGVAFIGAMLGVAAGYSYTTQCDDPGECDQIPFESATWKSPLDNYTRIRMTDDLIERNRLVGVQRSQINELLGEPSSRHNFPDFDYVYYVGPTRLFFGTNIEWLGPQIS
jgi:hypothetical protein